MDPPGAARSRAAAAKRSSTVLQASIGRDVFRSVKPDPTKVPKPYPKPRAPVWHVPKETETTPVARKPLSYHGAPPSCPVPRPKPTCSGIEEAIEASQGGEFMHWDATEGLHLHVGSPSPEHMETGEPLRKKSQQADHWSHGGCRAKPHCGEARQCIPVFKYAPKLCAKSEKIIRVSREQRLKTLWKKLDPQDEHVADLFALRPVAATLDLSERRFLQAVIPSLVQQAISRTSQDAAQDGFTLGPEYDEELRLHSLKPDVEGPVKIGTLSPTSRPPRFRQEDGEIKETAEEQQQEQEKQEQHAFKLYKRLAREQRKVVMLDGDQATANASATPHLFVCDSVFFSICMQLLSHAFGVEGIDQFRDTISYSCRKLVAAVDPEAAKKIPKPHMLAFSRKLDLERQQQFEKEQEEQQQRQRQRSRSLPPCGDPACCIEEKKKAMGRRWTRFDSIIQRYVRKKQQQQHLALAIQNLKEGEVCTFHPEINTTPRYLRKEISARGFLDSSKRQQQLQQHQQQGLLPTDPMAILRQFCSRYVADERCNDLIKALEECSFQPNAKRYVRQERERQQRQQQKEKPNGKDKKQQECCGDEGATAAAVDAIFQMLDSPFDAVFQADIRQWLQQEGEEGGTETTAEDDMDSRLLRQAKLAAAAPRKWVLDGRDPQHREWRQCLQVSECVLNAKGQPVIALDSAATGAAAEQARRIIQRSSSTGRVPPTPRNAAGSSRTTNPTEKWKESLRGGYLLPNMNFSLEDEEDKEKQARREAVKKEDWSKFIRVCGRGLETRAIPSQGTLKKVCDEFTHPPPKPPPTLWEHRRQRKPCLDRGPDARTYTAATTGRSAFSSSFSLARCREEQTAIPTVFTVATPAKKQAMHESYQLYAQLAREADIGALKLPPKIVGVKKDKVSYLEQQLAKMQAPLIVCTDTPI